jgi:diguanylate cyclase
MRQGDLVARYGGDEFVAYMRGTHDIGTQRASEIREAIMQSAVHWGKKSIHITASIGLYCQRLGDGIDVGEILDKADSAMYEAKQQGRNRVVDRKH